MTNITRIAHHSFPLAAHLIRTPANCVYPIQSPRPSTLDRVFTADGTGSKVTTEPEPPLGDG